jgi:glycosyltransferase involved in cell wall biosynthesis
MTLEPVVSVIVPVHNGKTFLAEALESVLRQTFAALELIVVDDGSVDESAAIVRALPDGRVRLVRQDHRGAGAARNRGVEESRGRYLGFLDADDVWMPDKLARQVAVLDTDARLDMVFGHYLEFLGAEAGALAGVPAAPGYSSCTLLIRRAAMRAIGPFATTWRVGEFVEWYARALDGGFKCGMLPDVVLRRRVHATNSTRLPASALRDYARVAAAIVRRRRTEGSAA